MIAIRGTVGSSEWNSDLMFAQTPFSATNFWQSKTTRHNQQQFVLNVEEWKASSKRKMTNKHSPGMELGMKSSGIGTESSELKKEMKSGMNTKMKLEMISSEKAPKIDGVMVHQGFFDIFEKLKQRLQDVLDAESTDNLNVYIGGHSLGAAIATLSSYFFADQYNLAAYTFGSPRTGNEALSLSVSYPLFRITNYADIVTTLPFSVMFNSDIPNEPYLYAPAGTEDGFTLNWGSIKNNHFMNVYIFYVEGQMKKQRAFE
jgi:predicted lipase